MTDLFDPTPAGAPPHVAPVTAPEGPRSSGALVSPSDRDSAPAAAPHARFAPAPPPSPGAGPASPPPGEAGAEPEPQAEGCPVCGVDPCGCGVEIVPIEGVIPIYDEPPLAALAEPAEPAPSDRLAAWRHPALAEWIDRRDALRAKHGARAATDPTRPPAMIAHDLRERAQAIADRLSGRPDAEAHALALNTLATLGALALTLHERLSEAQDLPQAAE